MRLVFTAALAAISAAPAYAQESYWIANRDSSDITAL